MTLLEYHKFVFIVLSICLFSRVTCTDDLCEVTGTQHCTCANGVMDCRSQSLEEFPKFIKKGTKAVYLNGNQIKSLSQIPEEADLETLSITENSISNISYDAFDNLDNLRTLILSNNSISTIADDIFEWNPLKLEVLHLDNNKMEFIQHFLFFDLEELTDLYLQNNQITFIHPHAFLQLKKLKTLRLDGNKLHTFNRKWIEKFRGSGLQELRFDNNPWSCDCAMIESQKWLKREKKSKWFTDLTTKYPLKCFTPDKDAGKLVMDSTLDLSKTCEKPIITGISKSASINAGRDVLLRCVYDTQRFPVPSVSWTAPNKDVYRLNTADNFEGITVHQDGSLLVENLKASDDGNYTCTATNKQGSFSAQTRITVIGATTDKDKLDTVVDGKEHTPDKVTKVEAATHCPDHCQCISRHIDCAGDGTTKLTEIPANIPTDSVTLSLATNGLTSLRPGAFSTLQDMEEIRLDNNMISDINSEAFSGMKILSTLTLRENELTSIHKGTFSPLKKLKVLVLDKNKLTRIDDEMFNGLDSVQWLYVRENLITVLSENAFTHLKSIRFIHLEGNALQVIYPETIKSLLALPNSNIQKIFVDENPFHCDCHVKELKEFLLGKSITDEHKDLFADGVICQFPAEVSEQKLDTITTDLECETYVSPEDSVPVDSSHYSGLLFGGIALGIVLTIVLFILWRRYGRRVRCYNSMFRRTGGKYNYSNLNGIDDGERNALTGDGISGSGTEAFV